MSYTFHYDPANDCILVKVQGEFDLSLLQGLASGVAELVEKVGCNRILNDLRQAKVTDITIDIYNMPQIAKEAGVFQACKRALVVSDKNSDFQFLETVFKNQGHQVRIFTDIGDAREWLFAENIR